MAMKNSSWDMLCFTHLLIRKIQQVGGMIMKESGLGLTSIPENRKKQMLVAKRVHERFQAGHFHHDENEYLQMQALSEYLASEHARIKNHPEPRPSEMNASLMIAGPGTTPPAKPESYLMANNFVGQLLQS